MNDIYQEYAFLEAQAKELENKKEALRLEIYKDMVAKGLRNNATPLGKFTLAKLKKYEYPEYVIEAGENYKALKAQAENTGEAICTEVDSLKFTKISL